MSCIFRQGVLISRRGLVSACRHLIGQAGASRGEAVIGLLVVSGLLLLLAAGGMLTQYIRTQAVPPEQEVQKNFTFTVPNDMGLIGEHTVQFTVTDNIDTFTSDPVKVVVTAKNKPPEVTAGEDLTVRLPREASLAGAVSDDGLPLVPGEVEVSWSKAAGPGQVIFDQVNQLATTATFSVAGTYVLRLTANDGQASAWDEVTVTVEAAPPAPGLSLQANRSRLAVGDKVEVRVRLEEATPFANWAQYLGFDRAKLELVDQQRGDFATFIADTRGLNAINTSGEVRSGGFSLANNNSGTGSLGIFTFKAVGVGQTTVKTANKSSSKPFGNVLTETDGYEILPDIMVGELTIEVLAENTAPVVKAGPGQQIRWPTNQVTLSGAVSDDGLPDPPAKVTVEWDKVSGPGVVTIAARTELETTVLFSQTGTYELRLAAWDGALAANDAVTIVVLEENRVPVAVGDKYNAWRGEALNVNVFSGVLSNDTDPDNDPLSAQLVKNVQHGELALDLNGSFRYVSENDWRGVDSFTYRAFDGLAMSEEETVEINVAVRNAAPVVSAGEDQVVNLPNSAILLGSVEDDGEPMGQRLQIQWSKLSGPGEVRFEADNMAATSAWFNEPGDYSLQLRATDGELTATDEVAVKVNTAPLSQDDSYAAFQAERLEVPAPGVLENDSDFDGDSLSAQLVEDVRHGNLKLNADGSFTYTSDRFFAGTEVFTYVASDGKASANIATVEIIVTVRNAAPQVRAGDDQIVELGQIVRLAGAVTDDGKPETPGQVNILWSKISGPGEVVFVTPNQAETEVDISLPGQYVLRLSASDGELIAADEVTVVIHTAPDVSAGDDLQPLINEPVQLNGAVGDDGWPAGTGGLAVEWRVVSGPAGSVEITDDKQAITEAIFKQEGDYVLRLSASDGHLTSVDEVMVRAVSRQAVITIPGQTRLEARPGQTIVVPFKVKSNILNQARLLLKMTTNIYFSEIKE